MVSVHSITRWRRSAVCLGADGRRESGPAGSYWTKETDQINTKLNSHACAGPAVRTAERERAVCSVNDARRGSEQMLFRFITAFSRVDDRLALNKKG